MQMKDLSNLIKSEKSQIFPRFFSQWVSCDIIQVIPHLYRLNAYDRYLFILKKNQTWNKITLKTLYSRHIFHSTNEGLYISEAEQRSRSLSIQFFTNWRVWCVCTDTSEETCHEFNDLIWLNHFKKTNS